MSDGSYGLLDHRLVSVSNNPKFSHFSRHFFQLLFLCPEQVLLVNPICMIAYAAVSWSFFCRRIFYEEITLLNFFGREYHEYQQKTGTGLPFIKGYLLTEEDSR